MNTPFSAQRSQPITLSPSAEGQTYALTAVAFVLTIVGMYIANRYAVTLLSTGFHLLFLVAELVLILTSRWWSKSSPLNYLLFGAFPLLSGITITPYILDIVSTYANGTSILYNAFGATACMTMAAAIFARTTTWNLAGMYRVLFLGLLGLIFVGIFQLFVPALQTTGFEIALSSIGVLVFAGFLAFDLQRIQRLGQLGANPFLMALTLYLDIFNLFLYVLRFMTAVSGRRN